METKADLELALKHAKERIKERTDERDEMEQMVIAMREHVKEADEMIERWIEAFELSLNDKGVWEGDDAHLMDAHENLSKRYNDLLREWNRFVPDYNAVVAPRRNVGRRLEASEAQVQEVCKLRKGGASYGAIVKATALSLRTVRTILARGTDQERTVTGQLRRIEVNKDDRLERAKFAAIKRGRSALVKSLGPFLKRGAVLHRKT